MWHTKFCLWYCALSQQTQLELIDKPYYNFSQTSRLFPVQEYHTNYDYERNVAPVTERIKSKLVNSDMRETHVCFNGACEFKKTSGLMKQIQGTPVMLVTQSLFLNCWYYASIKDKCQAISTHNNSYFYFIDIKNKSIVQ